MIFLTLYGLVDAPRLRDWVGGLLYRDKRERSLQVTDRIIETTSRYMLGNLAISVICGTVYGLTAVILGVPHPLALAVIAGVLDLIPTIGATIAGIIIGLVSLSVSLETTIAFVIVIVVYQQIENYVLQPTIIGKATHVAGFTVLASVLAFGALLGFIGAIIARADRGRAPDRRRGAHRGQARSHHRGGRRGRRGPTAGSLTRQQPPPARRGAMTRCSTA